jgi:hypothetical protein
MQSTNVICTFYVAESFCETYEATDANPNAHLESDTWLESVDFKAKRVQLKQNGSVQRRISDARLHLLVSNAHHRLFARHFRTNESQ